MKVCHAVLPGRRNEFECVPLVKAAGGSTALFKVTATFQLHLCNCFNSIYEHKLKVVKTPLSQNSSGRQVCAHQAAVVGTARRSQVRDPGAFVCVCGFTPGAPASSSHSPEICDLLSPTSECVLLVLCLWSCIPTSTNCTSNWLWLCFSL